MKNLTSNSGFWNGMCQTVDLHPRETQTNLNPIESLKFEEGRSATQPDREKCALDRASERE